MIMSGFKEIPDSKVNYKEFLSQIDTLKEEAAESVLGMTREDVSDESRDDISTKMSSLHTRVTELMSEMTGGEGDASEEMLRDEDFQVSSSAAYDLEQEIFEKGVELFFDESQLGRSSSSLENFPQEGRFTPIDSPDFWEGFMEASDRQWTANGEVMKPSERLQQTIDVLHGEYEMRGSTPQNPEALELCGQGYYYKTLTEGGPKALRTIHVAHKIFVTDAKRYES